MSANDERFLGGQFRDSPGLVVRAGWGALLLLRPDIGLRSLGGSSKRSRPARAIIRILGVRHLVEFGLELGHGPSWRRVGAAVDT